MKKIGLIGLLNSKAFEVKSHIVTNGGLLETESSILVKQSIDTGLKVSRKIIPLHYICTDRVGWMPVIWDYSPNYKNYLVFFGEGATGKFTGILYYIEIK